MRALLFFIPALVPVTSMRPEEANNKNWQERCCLCHYSQTWSLRKFTFDIAWAVSPKTKPECGKLCNAADAHGEGAVKVNKDTCVRPAERGSTKCEGSFNAHRLLVAGDDDKNGEHLGGELGATPNAQSTSGQMDDRSFAIQALQFMATPAGADWAEKAKGDTWKSIDEYFLKTFTNKYAEASKAGDAESACRSYNACLKGERNKCAFKYDFATKTLAPEDSDAFVR